MHIEKTCNQAFNWCGFQKESPHKLIYVALALITAIGATCLALGIVSYLPHWTCWVGGGLILSSLSLSALLACKKLSFSESTRPEQRIPVRTSTQGLRVQDKIRSDQPLSLADIPTDVLYLIFDGVEDLSANDLGSLSVSCRRLNQFLNTRPKLWEKTAERENIFFPPSDTEQWKRTIIEAKQLALGMKQGKGNASKVLLFPQLQSPYFFRGRIYHLSEARQTTASDCSNTFKLISMKTPEIPSPIAEWNDYWIAASDHGKVNIHKKTNNQVEFSLSKTKQKIQCFDRQEDVLVAGTHGGSVEAWNLSQKEHISTLLFPGTSVNGVLLCGESTIWAACGDGILRRAKLGSTDILECKGHTEGIKGLLKMGQMIVTWSSDKTLRIWNERTGQSEGLLEDAGSGGMIQAIQVGGTLFSISWDKKLRVWDLKNRRCTHQYATPEPVTALSSLFYAGGILYVFSSEGTLFKWTLPGFSFYPVESSTSSDAIQS